MSDLEARELINAMFDGYRKRKEEGRLYHINDNAPKIIIEMYYLYVNKPAFNELINNFKDKYLYNESKIEGIHSPEEVEGLGEVYDYIRKDVDEKKLNIYLLLILHQKLYSKVPYPAFGGSFRNIDVYLPNTMIETEPHDHISVRFQEMFSYVNDIIAEGKMIGESNNSDKLIEYIDKCLELKCELIRIHPFFDGNGRSVRAFLNVLFKLANLPPVYVSAEEKKEYGYAMNKAIVDNDASYIKTFYYYKICDSIIQLDIDLNKGNTIY